MYHSDERLSEQVLLNITLHICNPAAVYEKDSDSMYSILVNLQLDLWIWYISPCNKFAPNVALWLNQILV